VGGAGTTWFAQTAAMCETWTWDGANWSELQISGPPWRWNAGFASFR
jgi:hypothetical protein